MKDEINNNSDCAVIYPLFKYLNFNFVQLNNLLSGEYALAIIHLKNDIINTIYLSTDPLSVRPLFWSKSENYKLFGFSSLLSGLCNIKEFEKINRLN